MNHLNCFACKLFNSIFIISVIFETVTSNPAPVGRWGHPCHGRTAVRQPVLVTPSTEPETDDVVAQKLFIKAQEIIQLTNVIKANYFSERIQSTELKVDLDVSSPLTGFPSYSTIVTYTTFVEHLKEDYIRASTVAVFLEEMRGDEETSQASGFSNDFRILESKLYPFLCQLYNALKNRSVTNIPYVTRDVMTLTDRNTGSSAQRYNRDYMILKDTSRLFQSMASGYMSFQAGQS